MASEFLNNLANKQLEKRKKKYGTTEYGTQKNTKASSSSNTSTNKSASVATSSNAKKSSNSSKSSNTSSAVSSNTNTSNNAVTANNSKSSSFLNNLAERDQKKSATETQARNDAISMLRNKGMQDFMGASSTANKYFNKLDTTKLKQKGNTNKNTDWNKVNAGIKAGTNGSVSNPQNGYSEVLGLKQKWLTDKENTELNKKKNKAYAKEMEQNNEEAYNFGVEHPALATATSLVGQKLGGVLTPIGAVSQTLKGEEINPNKPYNAVLNDSDALREGAQQAIKNSVNAKDNTKKAELVDFLSSTGYSIAMSAADAALLGPVAGGIAQGLSAGASAVLDAKNRGASNGQAIASGVAQGVAEEFFEKYDLKGISDLMNKPFLDSVGKMTIKQFAKNMGKQMLNEGSSEAATDLANAVTDQIIMGDKSDFMQNVNYAKSQGLNDSAAFMFGMKQLGKQMGLSFAGGALSGAVFGSVGQGLSTYLASKERNATNNVETLSNTDDEVSNAVNNAVESINAQNEAASTPTSTSQDEVKASTDLAIEMLKGNNAISETSTESTEATSNSNEELLNEGFITPINEAEEFTDYSNREGEGFAPLEEVSEDEIAPVAEENLDNNYINEGFITPQNEGSNTRSVVDTVSNNTTANNEATNLNLSSVEERAKRFKGTASEIYVAAYNGQNIVDYDEAMASAYTAGRNGKSLGSLVENETFNTFYRHNPDAVEDMWVSGYEQRVSTNRQSNTESTIKRQLKLSKNSDTTDVSNYTVGTYNKYGWAYVNGVLNKQNGADFFNRISDIKNNYNVRMSSDGLYMVEASSKYNGAKDTIIYTDGNYESPSVEKVIKINADNETEAGEIKRAIYAEEGYTDEQSSLVYDDIRTLERNGFIKTSDRSSVPSFNKVRETNGRSRGNRKENLFDTQRSKDRQGSNNSVESNRSGHESASEITEDEHKFLDWVGDKTGLKIEISDSLEGNAEIDLENGIMRINPNSENLLSSTAHELTHLIKEFSEEDYNTLRDLTIDALSKDKGVSYSELFNSYAETYRAKNNDMSDEEIIEEIVADGATAFINDEKFAERVAERNKGLAEKLRDFFNGIAETLKKLINESGISRVGKALKNNAEIFEKASDTWYNALEKASKSSKAKYSENTISESTSTSLAKKINKEGVTIEGNAAVKYSLKTFNATDKDALVEDLVYAGFDESDSKKWVKDVSSIASIIAQNKNLDYTEGSGTWLKSNAETIKSLDGSFLCPKKSLFQGTYNAILDKMPDLTLDAEEYIDLKNLLKDKGYEVPCIYCYNESRTQEIGTYAREFVDEHKGQVTSKDLTTNDGLAKLHSEKPELYNEWLEYRKGAHGAQRSVKFDAYNTAYHREDIMSMSAEDRRAINGESGLRWFAFSDFKTEQMIDCMQATLDLAALNMKSYAYTKQEDFVNVFGNTNIIINLSVAGNIENGKLVFDDSNGMNIDTARKLRKKFSNTAGITLVGVNDEHILAAMASPEIDMIIPFHRSGLSNADMKQLGISDYTDYQQSGDQNEHWVSDGKKCSSNLLISDYWNTNKTGKENAQRYLRECARTGRTPKFSRYLDKKTDASGRTMYALKADGSTDGYWKLLVDHKMYDNNGVGIEQQEVVPNFNMRAAKNILKNYRGNANEFPVAQDVVDEFLENHGYDASIVKEDGNKYSVESLTASSNENTVSNTIKAYHKNVSEEDLKYAKEGIKEVLESTKNIQSRASEVRGADNESSGDVGWGVNMGRNNSLRNGGGVKTVGLGITKKFVREGFVDFRGTKLSSNSEEAIQEVATMAMVLRNPSFETFRVIYTRGNKIVGTEAITTKMVNGSYTSTSKNDIKDKRNRMKRLKADGYYLLHNHPSGRTEASSVDVNSTKFYSSNLEGFKGHLIIDHNKYGFIDANGKFTVDNPVLPIAEDNHQSVIDHPLLGYSISSPDAVANASIHLVHDNNYSAVIYTDASGKVTAVQEMHNNFVKSKDFDGYVANRKLDFGAYSAFAVTSDKEVASSTDSAFRKNILTDVCYFSNATNYSSKLEDGNVAVDQNKDILGRDISKLRGRHVGEDADNSYLYSYSVLTSKPDMKVEQITGDIEDRSNTVISAKKNIAENSSDGSNKIYVSDINTDVVFGNDAIRHGLRRNKNNYIVANKLGSILANSIRINELEPRKNSPNGSYLLLGVAQDNDNNLYPTIFNVKRNENNSSSDIIENVEVLNVYSANSKKIDGRALSTKATEQKAPTFTHLSDISISELLETIKYEYKEYFSDDVVSKLGVTKDGNSEYKESVKYSLNVSENDNSYSSRLGKMLSFIDYVPDNKAIERTAKRLKKYTGTDTNVEEIASSLKTLYEDIANNNDINGSELFEKAAEYAGMLIDSSKTTEIDPVSKEFYSNYRKAIKSYTFHMPEGFEGEVKTLGGLNNLRKEFAFTLNLTKKDGVSIDTMYQELADLYPDMFDADITNPADQLENIVETLRKLKPEETSIFNRDEDYDAAKYYATQEIFNAYISEGIADIGNKATFDKFKQQYSEASSVKANDSNVSNDGTANTENSASEETQPVKRKTYKSLTEGLNDEEINKRLTKLAHKYGVIEKGYKPTVDVDVPKKTSDKKNVRRFVRTVLESGIPNEEMSTELKKNILDEALSYEVASDADAKKHAEWAIDKNGIEYGQKEWDHIVMSSKAATKNDIAVGEMLLKRYAETGDTESVLRLTAELATEATRAGQVVQAMSMLKKLQKLPGAEGAAVGLTAIEKEVDKINRDNEKRFKGKKKQPPKVEIDEEAATEFLEAETEDAREAARAKIIKNIADQLPNTVADKLNQWRYLAMLGNPRTHIRNIIGNAVFMPAISAKNVIATAIESGHKGAKTKAISVNQKYKDYAANDFKYMKDILSGNKKGDLMSEILGAKKPFGNSKIAKPLNKLSDLNSNALEAEDMLFLKHHYIRALSMYLQSNKVDLESIKDDRGILIKARKYAVNEAQKATYRDASATAATLNQIVRTSKGPLSVFVESVLPFKKTPINILKRGLEYSPVGLINATTRQTKKLKEGDITFNEWADSLASGLTGTGIMALGAFLASIGVLMGAYSDDDNEKQMQKLEGYQEYAVNVLGTSYTVDWAAPVCMPLFVGVELYNSFQTDGNVGLKDILEGMQSISEPMFSLSMLSGLNDTIDAVSYSDSKLTALATQSVANYLSQFVPTFAGQVARTIDKTQRIAYTDKNSKLPSDAVYFIEKIQNKIPFLSFSNAPKLDAWGNENVSENVLLRAFENFMSPGYINSIDDTDNVNNEALRLYEETEDSGTVPQAAAKYFGQGDERIDLTSEQYHDYQLMLGNTSYTLLEKMISTDGYDKLTADEQVELFKNVYEYSKAIARMEVDDTYEPKSWISSAIDAYKKNGIEAADYIMYMTAKKEAASNDDDGTFSPSELHDFTEDYVKTHKNANASGLYREGLSKDQKETYDTWTTNGGKFDDYDEYLGVYNIKADKDANGKTVSYSKKNKVASYITDQHWNSKLAELAWERAGYSSDTFDSYVHSNKYSYRSDNGADTSSDSSQSKSSSTTTSNTKKKKSNSWMNEMF